MDVQSPQTRFPSIKYLRHNKLALATFILLLVALFLIFVAIAYIPSVKTKMLSQNILGAQSDSTLSFEVPGIAQDAVGNYLFPLGQVEVILNLTSGTVNKVDSVEAVIHYDPAVVSAQSIDFNQNLSLQYLTQDAFKCKSYGIEKDSSGKETGTIRIARSATPLSDECPPDVPPATPPGTAFPEYSPVPLSTTGSFAKIIFNSLVNITVPSQISYEVKSSFPNPNEVLNDSNVSAYIEPTLRTGESFDILQHVSNLSFVVGEQPTPQGDVTPPVVDITSPLAGSRVSGTVNITANVTDDVSVGAVEFAVDGTLLCSLVLAPYTCSWDTTTVNPGQHTITATAADNAIPIPNTASDSVLISVCNGDCDPPSAPSNLSATNVEYGSVSLSWTTSKDNIGVAGYYVYRRLISEANFTQLSSVTSGSYVDTTVNSTSDYEYYVKAFDASQNFSASSNVITVVTPAAPDNTPPDAPVDLSGSAVSTTQINLSWSVPADNLGGSGIAGYNVFRKQEGGTGTFEKINQSMVTDTFYGDGGLLSSTEYSYVVTAVDRANNESGPSNIVTVRTRAETTAEGSITGVVTDSSSGSPLRNVKVNLQNKSYKNATLTGADGKYNFLGIPPGTYNLKFQAGGYVNQTISVSVLNGVATVQNVVLVSRSK